LDTRHRVSVPGIEVYRSGGQVSQEKLKVGDRVTWKSWTAEIGKILTGNLALIFELRTTPQPHDFYAVTGPHLQRAGGEAFVPLADLSRFVEKE
jgi:hypothetical protein